MGKHGKDLGVELNNLWMCGRSFMPEMAGAFVEANHRIAGSSGDESPFGRQGTIAGTPGIQGTVYGTVYPAWNRVRTELQKIMGESATNVYDTGEALIRIAELYASTDGEAAHTLDKERQKFRSSGHTFVEPGQHENPVMP